PHGFAKAHQSFDVGLGMLKQVIGWTPRSRFAKHNNRRSTKPKNRLFLASPEPCIERMNLNDSSDRQSTNLHESKACEVARFQNVDLAFILKENVLFILQCMPIHGPEAASKPIVIQGRAVIGIVHMVVIHRGQSREEDGPPMNGRARSPFPRMCSALSECP